MAAVRKTKIVATIGPASDRPEVLETLCRAGMNVARLNMSHGSMDDHRRVLERVRQAAAATGTNLAVMVDLRGLEIRTGQVEGDAAVLQPGQTFSLYTDGRVGSSQGTSVIYQNLAEEVGLGDVIFLDDGKIELEVVGVRRGEIETRVQCGGTLRETRKVNVPGKDLALSQLRVEDREDLALVASSEVDYVAASFVRSAADIEEIRAYLKSLRRRAADHRQDREPSRRRNACRRSSPPPTAPWWPAATSASRCRWPRCRCCRSASSAPPSPRASR